ncbi:type II secretion system F family protein [Fictibacillus sp. b24]|uniref:type II secretion system F family protein n=1 Tax=Fictibacillus sp. b24 TaxID=3055863 RepID=UPI0025A2A9DA|nr:type II secretion system F family protein [Fictibacillus sp. b24]MDM5314867.1 type II secretion system F family protein [Fictibacillus sp. b24]
MEKLYIPILVFFIASIWFYLLTTAILKRKTVERRMEDYIPHTAAASDFAVDSNIPIKKQSAIRRSISSIAKLFRGLHSEKAETKLLQAGVSLKFEEFLVLKIMSALTAAALSYILHFEWFVTALFFLTGLQLPNVYISNKRKKRLSQVPDQLIDSLAMISNSLRAGFSFLQAMQLAGKEMPDPIGHEFDRCVREIGLGIPIEQVFKELTLRLPNKELEVTLNAIVAQRKSGGNLVELMETMEDTIRGRVRILAELKTLTAQGRMSAWVITLLPVGMGLYLHMVSPDYFGPMLDQPLGKVLLFCGAFFTILGWFLIQRIVKIEV